MSCRKIHPQSVVFAGFLCVRGVGEDHAVDVLRAGQNFVATFAAVREGAVFKVDVVIVVRNAGNV